MYLENPNAHHGTFSRCLSVSKRFEVNLVGLQTLQCPASCGGRNANRLLALVDLLVRVVAQAFVAKPNDHHHRKVRFERVKHTAFATLWHGTSDSKQFEKASVGGALEIQR